jgi:hypothetical protein
MEPAAGLWKIPSPRRRPHRGPRGGSGYWPKTAPGLGLDVERRREMRLRVRAARLSQKLQGGTRLDDFSVAHDNDFAGKRGSSLPMPRTETRSLRCAVRSFVAIPWPGSGGFRFSLSGEPIVRANCPEGVKSNSRSGRGALGAGFGRPGCSTRGQTGDNEGSAP